MIVGTIDGDVMCFGKEEACDPGGGSMYRDADEERKRLKKKKEREEAKKRERSTTRPDKSG